ncbi:MAG: PAS domain S-box protein [Candidatus Marinarcus sp.]|uniref:response regulator n=1 Tax=Candidatus Marinarcus sp. TaxID=3100987 RepID=UPI003AFFCE01
MEELNSDISILEQSTLLYVENDKTTNSKNLELFKKKFKEVIVAYDGNEALNFYKKRKNEIDLILTTISMPNGSGIELMKNIRELNDWDTPILVSTELSENSILLAEAIKFKVANIILKPLQEGTFLKIIKDILSEKQKEHIIEVQKNELEQFKYVLDKLNMVSETDLEGKITYVNQRFCDITGYTKEELIGKKHNIVRHPDTSDDLYKKMWENLSEGKNWLGKIKNRAKDGSTYHIKIIIIPLLNDKGHIEKYMGSAFLITDIEEEKQNLKKFILSQKLDQMNTRKATQEEINNRARELVLKAKQDAVEKEEKFVKYLRELEEELKRLRIIRERDKKQIAFLEKEYKEYIDTTDTEKRIFQEKMEKTILAGRQSYDKFNFLKKKNDALALKLKKSQEGITTLQAYVDEYRAKIENLQDVIKMHEKTITELKEGKH